MRMKRNEDERMNEMQERLMNWFETTLKNRIIKMIEECLQKRNAMCEERASTRRASSEDGLNTNAERTIMPSSCLNMRHQL